MLACVIERCYTAFPIMPNKGTYWIWNFNLRPVLLDCRFGFGCRLCSNTNAGPQENKWRFCILPRMKSAFRMPILRYGLWIQSSFTKSPWAPVFIVCISFIAARQTFMLNDLLFTLIEHANTVILCIFMAIKQILLPYIPSNWFFPSFYSVFYLLYHLICCSYLLLSLTE